MAVYTPLVAKSTSQKLRPRRMDDLKVCKFIFDLTLEEAEEEALRVLA